MNKQKFENTINCYKCGILIAATEKTIDDLPPKCCVPIEFRGKLIKVDSCKDCNNGRSPNDEYFQHWLITGSSSSTEKAKTIYLDKVKAAMKNPTKRDTIKRMIQKRELSTSSGIYLGQVSVLSGNEIKINSVLDSIGKAIIYHHFHSRKFPLPFGVVPFCIQNPDLNLDIFRFMLEGTVYVNKIPEIFEYRFGHIPISDGWIFPIFLVFYKKVVFHLHYLLDASIDPASSAG